MTSALSVLFAPEDVWTFGARAEIRQIKNQITPNNEHQTFLKVCRLEFGCLFF
jgi:hypothetical protein